MKKSNGFVHPYIPNSTPETKREMLSEVGAESMEDFYQDIPQELRMKTEMELPQPFLSEYELKNHVKEILAKNRTCEDNVSFLGTCFSSLDSIFDLTAT